jgi:hypothetical protein
MAKTVVSLALSTVICIMMLSCGDKNGTDSRNPGLSGLVIPINHNFADSLDISVMASDPQGLQDIDSVWGTYWYLDNQFTYEDVALNDNGVRGDTTAGDGRYSARLMPGDGEFQLGYYGIIIQAVDVSGNFSGQVGGTFWTIDGNGPILFNPNAPDSIMRGSPDPSYITIQAYDPDGLADIDSVYLMTLRPDSTSNNMRFYMFDDGSTYEDPVAGDGIYTIGIVTSDSNQLGDYTFTFYAFDMMSNQSNNPSLIITVY